MMRVYKSRTWNFNSHAHVERDVIINLTIKSCVNFNSHAHVERDFIGKGHFQDY